MFKIKEWLVTKKQGQAVKQQVQSEEGQGSFLILPEAREQYLHYLQNFSLGMQSASHYFKSPHLCVSVPRVQNGRQ